MIDREKVQQVAICFQQQTSLPVSINKISDKQYELIAGQQHPMFGMLQEVFAATIYEHATTGEMCWCQGKIPQYPPKDIN